MHSIVISRENWKSIVWPLPVGDLLYVGGAAQKLLAQYGTAAPEHIGAYVKSMKDALR